MTDDDKAVEAVLHDWLLKWHDETTAILRIEGNERVVVASPTEYAILAALRAAGYRLAAPDEAVVPRVAHQRMMEAGGLESRHGNPFAAYETNGWIYAAMVAAGERK